MKPHTFTTLSDFVESATTGDLYTEASKEGLTISTYRVRAARPNPGVLPVQRIMTDLVGVGNNDYAYRVRHTEGNLFDTRDRHNDPAYLKTSEAVHLLSHTPVTRKQHTTERFHNHHTAAFTHRDKLLAAAKANPATTTRARRPQTAHA